MFRRLPKMLAAAIIAGALIAIPHLGSADTSPPAVVSGTLTDASGQPTAGVVVLQALPWISGTPSTWPSQILVDSAKTAADGTFGFTAADLQNSSQFARLQQIAKPNHGWVNFTLSGMVPGGVGTHAFALKIDSDGTMTQQGSDTKRGNATAVSLAAARAVPASEYTDIPPPAGLGHDGCSAFGITYQTGVVRVGETHRWYYTTAWFNYSHQADGSLDYGVSAGGQDWSVGGSVHITNSQWTEDQVTDTKQFNGLHYRSWFTYAKYHEIPYAPFYWCGGYFIQSTGWQGGLDRGSGFNQTRDGQCQYYRPQRHGVGYLQRDQSQGFHYNLAVNVFGVELGGSNGYVTTVKMRQTLNRSELTCAAVGNKSPGVSPVVAMGPV